MAHKRYIALDREDMTLLRDMVQLDDSERAERLEAVLDELLTYPVADFTLTVDEG